MDLSVYNKDGQSAGRKVALDDSIGGIEPNDHAIWLEVKAIQAANRLGLHKTKERGEVRGGGAKPWRQKGTGRARAGTSRSPLWVGGGKTFGPRPHKYHNKVNKKTKQLAAKSALAYKAQSDSIKVIEQFDHETPKTKDFATMLDALEMAGTKVLFLTSTENNSLYLSARNIEGVSVASARSASTLDFMKAQVLLLQEDAIEVLNKRFTESRKGLAKTEEVK